MKAKLSIIIPQYKEDEKLIKPLLSSIENQIGINLKQDIEIIIVNDGSDIKLSEPFLQSFQNLNIQYYIENTNNGVSSTRNIGLKLSQSNYIMFCDADDRFMVSNALLNIFYELQQEQDMYIWDFDEELLIPEEYQQNGLKFKYYRHTSDNTFMHGKVFKRDFLISNNIFFYDDVRCNEDSSFCSLCRNLTKKVKIIPYCIYLWCYCPTSLSREKDYGLKTYGQWLNVRIRTIEDIKQRLGFVPVTEVISNILYIYFRLMVSSYDESLLKYKEEAEFAIYNMYNQYKELIDNESKQIFCQLYNQQRQSIITQMHSFEQTTFEQYINQLYEKYK